MNTKYLEYIIVLSEELNITNAAKRLNISQPALSNYLAKLESKLGFSIFSKKNKRLQLTGAGHTYIDYAIKICKVKVQTYQTLFKVTKQYSEQIIFGATSIRGSIIFSQIFNDFYSKFPFVNVQIKEHYTKTLLKKLLSGELDIVLATYINKDNPSLEYITFGKEEIILAIPSYEKSFKDLKSHSVYDLPVIDIKDVVDLPFVLGGPETNLRTISNKIFEDANINPTVIFETNNTALINNILTQEPVAGAAFIPKSYMKNNSNVSYYSIKSKPCFYASLFHKKDRVISSGERYFMYLFIKNELNSHSIEKHLSSSAESLVEEFEEISLWT